MSDVENEGESAGLRQLILKRSQVKGKLTRFINYLEKFTGDQSTGVQLEIRLDQAGGLLHIFNEIQDNIEYCDESEIESDERFAFEEKYYTAIERARIMLNNSEPVDQWSSLLIYLMTKKLDSKSDSAWQEHLINFKIKSPSLENFTEFLNDRCQLLESTAHECKVEKSNGYAEFKSHNKKMTGKTFAGHATQIACYYCNGSHPIYFCKKLQSMPISDRIRETAKLDICANCLRKGHNSSECRSRGCRTCGAKHNSMLHASGVSGDAVTAARAIHSDSRNIGASKTATQTSGLVTAAEMSEDVSLASHHSQEHTKDTNILLPTAIVLIKDSENQWHECRALLDSGSQPNFITRKIFDRLHLKSVGNGTPVMGVGATSTSINKKVLTTIKSMHSDYTVKLTFLVLDQITVNMPNYSFKTSQLQLPTNISLADPQFNTSSEIDLLIGATVFFDLLGTERIKFGAGQPILQQSVLGWVIAGPLSIQSASSHVSCNLATTTRLETQLEKFWAIEEVPGEKPQTLEEKECEKIFSATTRRSDNGHFVVQLPAKRNNIILDDNLDNAKNRLRAMERKFSKNPDFKDQYISFMTEYERLGHMTRIPQAEICSPKLNTTYYLPHHGVLNSSSTTTKLRVVFDGSSASNSGLSLNETLLVGPKLQDDLFDILIRFRKHNVVLVADIEKMYRQVAIEKNQRDLQRIVWRNSPSEEIGYFRLTTVTYGTSSAPYLAVRCLQQVAHENRHTYPQASETILTDFYVDDLISGSDTVESAKCLKKDLTHLLSAYGFPLRKWLSNSPEVLEPEDEANSPIYHVIDCETHKMLGVHWCAKTDTLNYSVNPDDFNLSRVTKRTILSAVSTIFDPLGTITPITIKAKLLIQELWKAQVGWDSPIPQSVAQMWNDFIQNLAQLNAFSLPHQVTVRNACQTELHAFCDASQKAYGACIYLRTISPQGITVQPLLTFPQPDFMEVPTNRLSQYEVLQQSMQRFWSRWSSDYLNQLQTRNKWTTTSNIKQGDLVLLIEDDTPPLHWKRGRIIQLHLSDDGLARTATILTARGNVTRAVQKVAVLPVDTKRVPDEEIETSPTTFQGRRCVTPMCDTLNQLQTRSTCPPADRAAPTNDEDPRSRTTPDPTLATKR
nr:unnamed protein product [Callosobruchus chinensis]